MTKERFGKRLSVSTADSWPSAQAGGGLGVWGHGRAKEARGHEEPLQEGREHVGVPERVGTGV